MYAIATPVAPNATNAAVPATTMEVCERRGNRAEALLAFDALRTRLRDELGVAPSAETQALHRALLH